MANRIAGITVEIGGDTTKLSTALKSVNSEIRSTQNELKDVNRLLKLDPGNADLMAQKQRLLRDAIAETKEKLEQLKVAAEQANEKLANGEISQQQYDALQREITETEQKLKGLEEQASKSAVALQKIAATGEKLKAAGDKISGVGQTLTRTVTAPVVGAGAAAIKTAADFDAAMSQVAAVSGATGDDFDRLRDKAREMGSKTKFSASEAAEAMNYMAMAGWKTEDMLEGVEGIMNLAAASGEDLATTSDIVTDALTAFGLSAGDSGHFADILAAASSNANTNVSMMGETFKYCAPIAGALGYSAEDTALAIGLMANAGIKSSQAGTSLRKIMTELNGEIKIHGSQLGDVTIQTANADGTMRSFSDILSDCRAAFSKLTDSEKASTAESLVGKTAMSGFLAIMNAGEGDVGKLENAIGHCSDTMDGYNGAAAKMAAVMQDNLSGQLTILKSQLQELAISIGDALMPSIREFVSHLQKLVDKFNSLDDGTKAFIVKVALVAAALGPVLIVIGSIISAVGTIMTLIPAIVSGISAVTGAFGALTAVMLANPITLIIAAVVALIAIFVVLWNKCDAFREFWINLWEKIKSLFSSVVDFIKENWVGLALFLVNPLVGAFKLLYDNCEGFREFWQNLWQGIKDFFSAIWDGIKSVCSGVVDGLMAAWQGFKDFWVGLWEGLKDVCSTVWEGIKGFCSSAWESIKENTSSTWESIKGFVSDAWEGIKGAAQTGWEYVRDGVSEAWENVSEGTSSTWEDIKEFVGSAWDTICEKSSDAWESIKEGTSSAWETIKEKTESAWSGLKESVSSAWDAIKEKTKSAAEGVKETVQTAWSGLKENSKNTWNSIKETVTNIASSVKEKVVTTWSDLKEKTSSSMSEMRDKVVDGWNTIKEKTSTLWGEIKDKVVTIAGAMKEKFVSTVQSLAETFSSKLHDMKERTTSGLHELGAAVSDKLSSVKSSISDGLSHILEAVGEGMGNMMETIKEKLGHVGEAFMDIAKQAFTWGKDIISNLISGISSMLSSLGSKIKSAASTIKSYIGFSEPEKGPLSDFHTYMPDMIDLMCKGIEGNLGKLKGPMTDLASAIIPGQSGTVAIKAGSSNGSGTDMTTVEGMLAKYLPQMARTNVVLDTGVLVGELSGGINRQLGKAYL